MKRGKVKRLKKIPTRVYRLPKGMPRDHALAAAKARDGKDFRGFTYSEKTGKATLT